MFSFSCYYYDEMVNDDNNKQQPLVLLSLHGHNDNDNNNNDDDDDDTDDDVVAVVRGRSEIDMTRTKRRQRQVVVGYNNNNNTMSTTISSYQTIMIISIVRRLLSGGIVVVVLVLFLFCITITISSSSIDPSWNSIIPLFNYYSESLPTTVTNLFRVTTSSTNNKQQDQQQQDQPLYEYYDISDTSCTEKVSIEVFYTTRARTSTSTKTTTQPKQQQVVHHSSLFYHHPSSTNRSILHPLSQPVVVKVDDDDDDKHDDDENDSTSGDRNIVVRVTVQSNRTECQTGQCLYRTYISGPTLHGNYLQQQSRRSNTTSLLSLSLYSIDFPFTMISGGNYSVLVLLETYVNTSNVIDEMEHYAVDYRSVSNFTFGERISLPNNTIPIHGIIIEDDIDEATYKSLNRRRRLMMKETVASRYPNNISIQQKGQNLPMCRYTINDITTNQFEWIERSILERAGYTPNTTLMIPDHLLDPTRDIYHWENYSSINPQWILPYQKYVWHAPNCIQKWIGPNDIIDLATKEPGGGGIHLVIIGTSRMNDTATSIRDILYHTTNTNATTTTTTTSSNHRTKIQDFIQITEFFNQATNDTPEYMKHLLQQFFNTSKVCAPDLITTNTSAPTLVIMLSHGIWESKYHPPGSIFNFTPNVEMDLQTINDLCYGRRLHYILMTNPMVHPFDARSNWNNPPKRIYDNLTTALTGARITKVNWAWKSLAAKYNIAIVDGEQASLARRDTTYDTTHYRLWDPLSYRPLKGGGTYNEVTVTFAQMLLAATIQVLVSSSSEENLE